MKILETAVESLVGKKIETVRPDVTAPNAIIRLSDGTEIWTAYWRLIGDPISRFCLGHQLSSFDHGQKYGLNREIDAFRGLSETIVGTKINQASVRAPSADIVLSFDSGCRLEVFSFTAGQAWILELPDNQTLTSNLFL